jgi:hypothetical protein
VTVGPLDGIDPVELGVALSQLTLTSEHVAAARLALEVVDARYAAARVNADLSRDVGQACRDEGVADHVADARRTWAARGEVARDDADAARKEAGDAVGARSAADIEVAADRADQQAQRAERLAAPVAAVPAPRPPSGAERTAGTEAALKMANDWLEERDRAEHERHDYAHGYDRDVETIQHTTDDTAEDGRARLL